METSCAADWSQASIAPTPHGTHLRLGISSRGSLKLMFDLKHQDDQSKISSAIAAVAIAP